MASKVLNNIEKFSNNLQKSLTPSNKSVNVSYLVSGLLIVYAVLVAPMLPKKSLNFLKHTWVRVTLIILISLISNIIFKLKANGIVLLKISKDRKKQL